MSTRRKEYAILGINIGCGDLTEEQFEALEEACLVEPELAIVRDGKSGEYCVVGKILAEGGEFEGLPFTEINFLDSTRVISALHRVLPQEYELDASPVKLFAFTH